MSYEMIEDEYIESKNDRFLRLRYLDTLIANAERVLLYGDKYDTDNFGKYLTEKGGRIKTIVPGMPIKLNKKDVIFPLLIKPEIFVDLFNSLTRQGVVPWQIIPPPIHFFPFLAERLGFIKKPNLDDFQLPVLATIDTVNACNLDCATCLKPRWQESGEHMSFELFSKCLDKLQIMGIRSVELYNYTEPFLNPEILRFMTEVKKRGLRVGISSNLSLPHIPNLKECTDLLEEGDWFVITISGVNQDIYQINHRKGKIENVIENIKSISKSQNSRRVTLRLLKFDYNLGEMPAARNLAQKYGLSFQWYKAVGSPFDDGEKRKKHERRVRDGLSYNDYEKAFGADGFYCPFITSRNMVINHKGNVELCCADVTRPYDLGSFLEQDISVLQMKRMFHPLCHSCNFMCESPDEYAALRKVTPVDPARAANVLRHAMDTVCLENMMAPQSFMPGVKDKWDFLCRSIAYFTS